MVGTKMGEVLPALKGGGEVAMLNVLRSSPVSIRPRAVLPQASTALFSPTERQRLDKGSALCF